MAVIGYKERNWSAGPTRHYDVGSRTHIRGDKHPLRQLVRREILVEHGKVLALSKTVKITRHGIVAHQGASAGLEDMQQHTR